MIHAVSQNGDFKEKRLAWLAPTPSPGGADAPRPQSVAAADPTIKDQEEAINTVGDLPGLEKADELKDTRELKQSATDIIKNVAKIQSLKPDELVKEYRERYGNILVAGHEVTAQNRKDIQEAEWTRLINLAGDAKKQIEEIRRPDESLKYTDAVDKILGGQLDAVFDKQTKELIASLDLKNTNTVKLHQKVKEKSELEFKSTQVEKQLDPLKEEVEKHNKALGDIEKVEKDWSAKADWGYKGPIVKVAAYATAFATLTLATGGLGVGMIGASNVFGWGAALSSMGLGSAGAGIATLGGWLPGLIGSTVSPLISGWGLGNVLGVTAMIYSGYQWGYQMYTRPAKFWHKMVKWQKERDVWKKKQELEIDGKLKDEIDEAQDTIKKYKGENDKKATKVGEQKTSLENRQKELTDRINGAQHGDDVSAFQDELTKVSEGITALEAILKVLNTASTAETAGLGDLNDENAILERIGKMGIDKDRQRKLEAVAADIDKTNRENQKKLHDMAYKGGLKPDVLNLDDEDTVAALTKFLDDSLLDTDTKPTVTAKLEALKGSNPKLYQTIKALDALPMNNLYRRRTSELLKVALEEASKKPSIEAVTTAFNRIPQDIKDYATSKPEIIYYFHSPSTELGSAPRTGQSFSKWIKFMNASQLDKLLEVLEVVRTNAVLENKKLVDKMSPLKGKIQEIFNDIDGTQAEKSIQKYLNGQKAAGLKKISEKLGTGQSFTLAAGNGSFLETINATQDRAELEKVRDILAQVKGTIEIDEGVNPNTPELSKPLDDEINVNFGKIDKKDSSIARDISNHPKRLTDILIGGKQLPNPADNEKYEEYRNRLSYQHRKLLRDILKAIVDEDYVLNEAGDHLVISIEKLREEIVELAEEIRTKTENETAGTSRPKTTFTPTELNQAIGIFMGHGRVSRANLSGTTVKVAIAKIKKTDVLDEIKMCLGDVLNKSFCSVLQRNKYVTNADIDDKYTRALEGTYASGRSQLRQAVKDTIVADASWLKLYDPELDANNGEQLTDYWARQTNYNVRERIVEALKKFENKDLPARPIAPPAPPSGPEPKITDIVGTASPLTGVIPANTTLLTLNDPGNTPQFSVTEITPTPAIRGLTAAHFSIDATTRVLKCTQELNPGIYKVKIKLANASQKSAERDLDFKIEPEVPQDSDIEFTGNVAALEGIQASGTTLRTLKPSAPGKALIYSIASLKVNGIDKTNIGSFLRLEDNELKATRDLLLANYEVKFKATNSKGPPVEKLLPEIVIKVKKPEAVKFANGTGTEEIQARKVAAADSIVLFTLKPQPGVKFELISSIPDRIGIDAQGRVIIAAGSADLDLHAGDRVEIVVRGVTDTIPTVEGPPEILTIKVVAPAGTPQNAPGGGAHPDIKKLLTEIDELKKLIAAPKNAPLTENEKKEAIGLLTLKRRDYEAVLADPQLGTTDPDRKTIEEARDAVNRRIIDLTR